MHADSTQTKLVVVPLNMYSRLGEVSYRKKKKQKTIECEM